ncbi:uncharacterized protein [Hetaerina americana]|uniref:uncharacterized protein n=1 Tax=Hetaerina americana TaxID=62018 RepID=UPI003A7F3C0D
MERRRRPRGWAPLVIVALCCARLASSVETSTAAFGLRTRPLARHATAPSRTTTTPRPGEDGDSLLLADAGGGGGGGDAQMGQDDKKSLAQQVAEGKYGLIQDLLPKDVKRPGIVSYAANSEVPADTADNLGGLDQEDIWLAEDHVLVLAGGGFRDKGGGGLVPQWPAIDDYQAPRRQVKIPARPSVPPPFPVQLRDGERPQFIGGHPGNFPPGSGPPPGPWVPANGSLPAGPPPPFPPPQQANLTDPFDEDDPSLYYPPPYDFYYKGDNTTQIPPGPLVPGIVLPPPPDFFSPLNEKGVAEGPPRTTSTPGPRYLPAVEEVPTTFRTPQRPKTAPAVAAQKEARARGEKTAAHVRNKGRNNVRVRYPGQTDTPLYYYDGPGISQQIVVTSSSPDTLHVEDLYERQRPSGFQKQPAPPATKNHVIYIFTADEDFQGNQVSTETPPVTPRDVPTPPRVEDFHSGRKLVTGGGGYLQSGREFASPGPQTVARPATKYFFEDYYANGYNVNGGSEKQSPQNNQPDPYAYYTISGSAGPRGNGTRGRPQAISSPSVRPSANHQTQKNQGQRTQYAHQSGIYDVPSVTYRPQGYPFRELNNRGPVIITTQKPPSRQRGQGKQQPHGVSVITVKPAVLYAGSANRHRGEEATISTAIPRPDTSYSQNGNPGKEHHQGITIVTSKPYVYSFEQPMGPQEATRNQQTSAFDSVHTNTPRPHPAAIGGYNSYHLGGSQIRFPQQDSVLVRGPEYVLVHPTPRVTPRPAVQYQEYFEAQGHQGSHLSNVGDFGAYDGLLAHSTSKPLHVQVHGDLGLIPQRETFHEDGAGHYVLTTQAPAVKPQRNNSPYVVRPYGVSSVHSTATPEFDRRPQPAHSHRGVHYKRPQQTFSYEATAQPRYPSPTPAPFAQSFPMVSSTTVSPLPAYFTTKDVSLFDDATKNYFNVFGQKLNEGGQAPRPTTPLPFDDRSGQGAIAYSGAIESSTPIVSLEDDIRVNFREPLPPINPDSEFTVPREGLSRDPSKHQEGAVVSYQLPGVDGKGSAGASHYYFLTPQPVSSDSRTAQQGAYYQQEDRRPSLGSYWTGYSSG